MTPDENQIIEQVKQGNADASRIIIDRYRDAVYGLALRMVTNSEEAEELAQDAFIKAFNAIKSYRADSKFSTWLYRITYNTCISHLRKKKPKNVELKEIHRSSDFNSGYNNLVKEDNIKVLKIVLNRIKPDDRAIIQLFYLEEKSIQEIVEITGLTGANIKVKLHRLKQKMKNMMEEIGFNMEKIFA